MNRVKIFKKDSPICNAIKFGVKIDECKSACVDQFVVLLIEIGKQLLCKVFSTLLLFRLINYHQEQ